MKNIYLRYLQFVSSDEIHQQKQEAISPIAIFLLNKIAVIDFEEKPISFSFVCTNHLVEKLKGAKRPLIIAGNGIHLSNT